MGYDEFIYYDYIYVMPMLEIQHCDVETADYLCSDCSEGYILNDLDECIPEE